MSALLALILVMPTLYLTQKLSPDAHTIPDHITVYKSQKLLVLEKDGRVIQKYPASFGFHSGKKERSGDGKTPEGRYTIIGRKHKSIFKHSLHISYPNTMDIAHALILNVDPGNEITIHGTGDDPALKKRMRGLQNWTRGCIGLHDKHISDLYRRVPIGTIIDIYP